MPERQQTQKPGKPDSTFQKQAALTSQNPVSHPASIIQRARINPKSLTTADVLQLQRTIGNRAVGRLLSEIRNPSKVQQAAIQRQEVPEEEKEPLQGMFGKEPEEETCPSCVQRQEKPEEEEPLQGKFEIIQRLEPEEEKLQMKSVVQRQEISEEEDEPVQGKMIGTIQRQEIPEEEPLQKKSENNTGMPDNLKDGVESLSGIDMSDVRVHYNSSKPAEVGALAYTQGMDIHVAPGQEKYLPHEAWHVVQQVQERVRPTMQLKDGVPVNDDKGLENEADVMGSKAIQMKNGMHNSIADPDPLDNFTIGNNVVQLYRVVRGGMCDAGSFRKGSGVIENPQTHKLTGISTQSDENGQRTLEQICAPIKNNQIGLADSGEITQIGGQIVHDGDHGRGNYHATVNNITDAEAVGVFHRQPNPARH